MTFKRGGYEILKDQWQLCCPGNLRVSTNFASLILIMSLMFSPKSENLRVVSIVKVLQNPSNSTKFSKIWSESVFLNDYKVQEVFPR